VAAPAQNGRLGLLLDEFTYLLEIDPSIAGQLQNLWDQTFSRANLFLVICGSHLGMMLRHTLSYQAPLYGRATAQLRLPPFPFGMTARYFPNFDDVGELRCRLAATAWGWPVCYPISPAPLAASTMSSSSGRPLTPTAPTSWPW
jgi:AAA+ ATPase superfamily predicted ATPase